MAVYTHDFKLEFDGVSYEGQIEFNDDGVASYAFDNPYNLTIKQTALINHLMETYHQIFNEFGNTITTIEVNHK